MKTLKVMLAVVVVMTAYFIVAAIEDYLRVVKGEGSWDLRRG